jgi:hypothetical protein
VVTLDPDWSFISVMLLTADPPGLSVTNLTDLARQQG